MSNKSRDNFIDVLRGISIIAIVQTHTTKVLPCGFEIAEFMLCFCVIAFMFASGYLFKPVSDSKGVYLQIGKRFVKLWYLFFAYSIAMIALNPILLRLGIIGSELNIGTIDSIYRAFTMHNEQHLLYPMWFVPMFLVASCIFTAVFAFAERRRHKVLWHCGLAVLCALVGLYSYVVQVYPDYYVNASLLCIPLMYIGYIAGQRKEIFKHCLTWWGGIIAMAAVLFVVSRDLGTIDLSSHSIISPALFYPVAAAGLYMALSFSKYLARVPYLSSVLACAGRNSFHIMALHLLVFKLFDALVGRIKGLDAAVYQVFPAAFDFWPIYVIVGTAVSIAIAELGKYLIAVYNKHTVHQ